MHSAGPQGQHQGSSDFVAWLNEKLGDDYEFHHPIMPRPEAPDYAAWKPALKQALGSIQDDPIFIGHSLGGSVLLKYLAEEQPVDAIKALCLVSAPMWSGDENWQHEAFNLPPDFPASLPSVKHVFIYHSKNDPIVDVSHASMYAEKMPQAKVYILDGGEHVYSKGLLRLVTDIQKL